MVVKGEPRQTSLLHLSCPVHSVLCTSSTVPASTLLQLDIVVARGLICIPAPCRPVNRCHIEIVMYNHAWC